VHRAHATTVAITQFLPSVAGLLLEHEYTTIIAAMKHPARPLVAVMGGAKISDKLPVLNAMIPVADTIVVGGALANTFLTKF
jgi:phosphoglycerate kinase